MTSFCKNARGLLLAYLTCFELTKFLQKKRMKPLGIAFCILQNEMKCLTSSSRTLFSNISHEYNAWYDMRPTVVVG